MVTKKSWEEFREVGLLWWINQLLHVFGWSIVYEFDDNNQISNVYPARVKYRGFDENTTSNGYRKISKYLKENANDLLKEAQE